jgi:hypothetical protein
MIVGLDAPCPAQNLMVQPQFGVIVNGASLQVLPPGRRPEVRSAAGGKVGGVTQPSDARLASRASDSITDRRIVATEFDVIDPRQHG